MWGFIWCFVDSLCFYSFTLYIYIPFFWKCLYFVVLLDSVSIMILSLWFHEAKCNRIFVFNKHFLLKLSIDTLKHFETFIYCFLVTLFLGKSCIHRLMPLCCNILLWDGLRALRIATSISWSGESSCGGDKEEAIKHLVIVKHNGSTIDLHIIKKLIPDDVCWCSLRFAGKWNLNLRTLNFGNILFYWWIDLIKW